MLTNVIAGGEGKTVEFRQDVPNDVMRYVPTAVAFANTMGGVIVFGISDAGEVVGIEENQVESRIEKISNDIENRTEPIILNSRHELLPHAGSP